MENDLIIKWNEGRSEMLIHMDVFFPCTLQQYKMLLKIVALDYEHDEEIRETLKSYFQNRIPNLSGEAEAKRKEAAEYREKAKESKDLFNQERKRILNGGDPPYLESKYSIDYENNYCYTQKAEKEAKKLSKSEQMFRKYLRLL